jgi:hypothetical protein
MITYYECTSSGSDGSIKLNNNKYLLFKDSIDSGVCR